MDKPRLRKVFAQFLINKRLTLNNHVGSFQFAIGEVDGELRNKEVLKEFLDKLKERVIYFDEKERPVIKRYTVKDDVYTIHGCYTPQLKVHLKNLENQDGTDTGKSNLYISISEKLVYMGKRANNQTLSITPKETDLLLKLNGDQPVKAENIYGNNSNPVMSGLSRLKKDLNHKFSAYFGITDELIIRTSGYMLNRDKFNIKFLKQ
ncbi:MAG: hypothetical protein WCO55_00365 [Candidatus Falkowbacteria bacterium]